MHDQEAEDLVMNANAEFAYPERTTWTPSQESIFQQKLPRWLEVRPYASEDTTTILVFIVRPL